MSSAKEMARANYLSMISICISVASASFAFYQWRSSQRETKVSAAMEISKNWVQDSGLERQQKILATLATEPGYNVTSEERNDATNYVRRLEYVAFLLNRDKIDETYVAIAIKCDLAAAPGMIDKLQFAHKFLFPPALELRKASPRFIGSCVSGETPK